MALVKPIAAGNSLAKFQVPVLVRASLIYAMKANREDTRWLRLMDGKADGRNNWLLAIGDLCFGGAEMVWKTLASLVTLFR
jgi:hypothetical protein